MPWVDDGVGGLLGGDKAYRQLTVNQHTDKVKRSIKAAVKVLNFLKIAL